MASTVLSTEEVPQALLLVGWVVGKVVGTSALFSYRWVSQPDIIPFAFLAKQFCLLLDGVCLGSHWVS